MASEFLINSPDDLMQVSSFVHDHFGESNNALKLVITESSGNGNWGMARLWRKWMSVTAEFMAQNGATMPLMIDKDGNPYGSRKFSPQDAHELFTAQWLGLDPEGNRLSWQKKEGANVADKGQRYVAMMKHQNWCIEKGINLPLPRNSEYNELQEQQSQ